MVFRHFLRPEELDQISKKKSWTLLILFRILRLHPAIRSKCQNRLGRTRSRENRKKPNFRLSPECSDSIRNDWMHDTARCFGYPSDSTRAARERAREQRADTACAGLARRSRAGPHPLRLLQPLALTPAALLLARAAQPFTYRARPCGPTPRPCGSLFSHTWPASGSAH